MDKKDLGQLAAGAGMAYGAAGLANDVKSDVTEGNEWFWDREFGEFFRLLMTVALATTWTICISYGTDFSWIFTGCIWLVTAVAWYHGFAYIFCLIFSVNVVLFLWDVVRIIFFDGDFSNFAEVVVWFPRIVWPGFFAG